MSQVICNFCKKEYTVPPSVAKYSRFCSKICKDKAQLGKPTWNTGKCRPFPVTDEYREKMRKIAKSKGYGQWMKGKKPTAETLKKRSEKLRGDNHPNYKGGRHLGSDGYMMVLSLDHPNKDIHNLVREHRLVAEKCLGRYMTSEEVIHHINEVKTDNRPENLYLFSCEREHGKHHKAGNPKLISNLI